MKIGTSLLILLLAIIALVAEAMLYFLFGLGAAFSGNLAQIGGIAYFFVSMMIITIALGIAAPVCAIIESSIKKENLGYKILFSILGVLTLFLLGAYQMLNHFDTGSEKQRQTESIQNSTKIAPGPFGLSKGMSKDEIQKITDLNLTKKIRLDQYVVKVVPVPHESFEFYILTIDPYLGLCNIQAQGKTIQTNPQGDSLQFEFNKMKSALSEKYGPISDDVNQLKAGSLFKSPASWMIALNKKERELMAIWENKGDKQLGNALSTVALVAAADSMYEGKLGLIYEFLNNDECNRNHEKIRSKGL